MHIYKYIYLARVHLAGKQVHDFLVTFSKIAATDFFTPLSDFTLTTEPASDLSESGLAYFVSTDFFFLLEFIAALGGDEDGDGWLGGCNRKQYTVLQFILNTLGYNL